MPCLAAGLLGGLFSTALAAGPVPTDNAHLVEAARMLALARAAEQRGDIEQAALKYHTTISYINFAYDARDLSRVFIGGERLGDIGRRGILLQLKMANAAMNPKGAGAYSNETGAYKHDRRAMLLDKNNERMDSRAHSAEYWLEKLKTSYGNMCSYEPNNPTWPYLEACMFISVGKYLDGHNLLEQCMRTTGGEASIRAKAKTLQDHIEPGYRDQLAQMEHDKALYQQYMESGQFMRDMARIWFNEDRERYRKYGR